MTSFADFANVCREIENISSSLEMTERVAEFFKLVDTEELHIAIYFIMGDVFPDWSDYDLGVGTGLFYTSLSK
ncbi:DNA ligase, partial [Methanosalsum natronophilum]